MIPVYFYLFLNVFFVFLVSLVHANHACVREKEEEEDMEEEEKPLHGAGRALLLYSLKFFRVCSAGADP